MDIKVIITQSIVYLFFMGTEIGNIDNLDTRKLNFIGF